MELSINHSILKNTSRKVFRLACLWYKGVISNKINLPDDELMSVFERIHLKAIGVHDNVKISDVGNADKRSASLLIPILASYGKAILEDRLPELNTPIEPAEHAIEKFTVVFIFAYVISKKNDMSYLPPLLHLPPELLSDAITPFINDLVVFGKDPYNFNSLSVSLIINILKLNSCLNQADKLEKLYNQTALNKIWEEKKNDIIVGVIMLDGDKFKEVNDKCGHATGDKVLKIYQDSILEAIGFSPELKSKTFSSRWGGEEFCVCVFDTNEEEMIGLSKEIKSKLESLEKWKELSEKYNQIDFPRTFSQGIALGEKSNFKYLNALVDVADKQMYKAKENGRDCIYYNSNKILESTPHQ